MTYPEWCQANGILWPYRERQAIANEVSMFDTDGAITELRV